MCKALYNASPRKTTPCALDGPQDENRSQYRQQEREVAEWDGGGWVPGVWLSSHDGAA